MVPTTGNKLPRRAAMGAALQTAGLCLGLPELLSQETKVANRNSSLKLVDMHIHVANTHLPGVPAPTSPGGTSFDGPPQRLADAIKEELEESGTEHAFCMPQWGELRPDDPLGIKRTAPMAGLLPVGQTWRPASPTVPSMPPIAG